MILIKQGIPFTILRTDTDESGRLAILHGQLGGVSVLLLNVYGPSIDDPTFFSDVWRRITSFPEVEILWGGDFNACLYMTVDCMGSETSRPKQASEVLRRLMDAGQLWDVWRLRHPGAHESTFVFSVHGTWSLLDFLLVTEAVCTWAVDARHMVRIFSAHSPVLLELQVPACQRPTFTWHLQPSLLSDPVFKHEIGEAIHNFFKENEGSVDSGGVLWETFKMTIRGMCMGAQVGVSRNLTHRIQKLAADISALKRSYDSDPSPSILSAIRELVTEHNETVDQEMAHRSRLSKACYYGEGGRPSRSLAQKLSDPRSQDHIKEILDEVGEAHYTTADISEIILDFYAKLYASRADTLQEEIHEYLNEIALAVAVFGSLRISYAAFR